MTTMLCFRLLCLWTLSAAIAATEFSMSLLDGITEVEPPRGGDDGSVVFEIEYKSHFLYLMNHFDGFILHFTDRTNRVSLDLAMEWENLARKNQDLTDRGVVALARTNALPMEFKKEVRAKVDRGEIRWEDINPFDVNFGMTFFSGCMIGTYERSFEYSPGPVAEWGCSKEDDLPSLVGQIQRAIMNFRREEQPRSDRTVTEAELDELLRDPDRAIFVYYRYFKALDTNESWEKLAVALKDDANLSERVEAVRMDCFGTEEKRNYCTHQRQISSFPSFVLYLPNGEKSFYQSRGSREEPAFPLKITQVMMDFLNDALGIHGDEDENTEGSG